MKLSDLRNSHWAFIGFFGFSFLWALIVGAPWVDLDGNYYQHMAEHLGGHIFKSNWYPVGMPLLIRLLWTLGLSVFWVSVLANALRLFVQYLIFRKLTSTKWALLAVLVTQGLSWLVLGTMLKAESFFITAVLGIALSLLSKSHKKQIGGSLIFFVVALLFRHAGLFLAPAFFLALWKVFSFDWKKLYWPFGFTLGGMLIANTINSGNPLKPSKESFACMHFISAANSFDYCQKGLAKELCALDPRQDHLNAHDLSMDHLNALQFNPDLAPQKLLTTRGSKVVCEQAREIYTYYLQNKPLEFIKEIIHRIWNHFGPWQSTELSLYRPRKDTPTRMELFLKTKSVLMNLTAMSVLIRIFVVFGLLFALIRAFKNKIPVAATFIILAALTHCGGIVLNNPFLVMRYQEVTSLMVLTGLLIILLDRVKTLKKSHMR